MNNLTFNDIAMPMSFYEETGVWGYMVDPDHKNFDAIQKALKANPEEDLFPIYSKDALFSYIYEIYPCHDLYYEKVIQFSNDETEFLDEMASLFDPDESTPYNTNQKLYKKIDNKVKPYFDQIMEKYMNRYHHLILDDGSIILSTEEKEA
jgi:hypothetical protein